VSQAGRACPPLHPHRRRGRHASPARSTLVSCLFESFTSMLSPPGPLPAIPQQFVCCPETPTEQWMRDVAREMNLSETAFLTPVDDGYNLRWFTPRGGS